MTDVRILVGTKKAAFIYSSDERREKWTLSDPIFTGWSVYHMNGDDRDGAPRLYAAANHWAWGPSVARSTDLGKTWESRSPGLGFPQDMGVTVGNVWHVAPGHQSEPGVVYAGVQPAGLFRSEDWGESWQPVDSLNRHADREKWTGTGGGDSCVHSVEVDLRDAKHMYAIVSAGGSYESRDAGQTWAQFSHNAVLEDPRGIKFVRDIAAHFGQPMSDVDPIGLDEMHKFRVDRKDPDRMWVQAHTGVFKSEDGGATWKDVTAGLPSFHGFPIAVTKRPPDATYVVPIAYAGTYDNFRVCDGQFAVYRTRDRGATWEACTKGLPGPHDYQSAYREAMDTDGLDQEGVYVGTTNGAVYASMDGGDSWQRLPGTLPPILSVTAVAF